MSVLLGSGLLRSGLLKLSLLRWSLVRWSLVMVCSWIGSCRWIGRSGGAGGGAEVIDRGAADRCRRVVGGNPAGDRGGCPCRVLAAAEPSAADEVVDLAGLDER